MKRAKICVLIFSILSVLWTGYIFHNSTENGEVSNHRSEQIAEQIEAVVGTENLPTVGKTEQSWNAWIRKAAHGFEFALLGVCVGGLLIGLYLCRGRWYLGSALFAVLLVGVSDEFIQDEDLINAPEIKDVLLDFSAGAAPLLIISAVFALVMVQKKTAKRKALKF